MNNKKGTIKFIIGVIIIIIITVVLVIIFKDKKYKITYNGNTYICSVKEKYDGERLGFSKETYNSEEEAKLACITGEIAILSPDGYLEEYQEPRNDCTLVEETDTEYKFTPSNGYNYKECVKID